ncbi:MAG: DNA repair protein RecN [Pseudomonadales bacterium]|nr:DNA repair protein RecN [Pseudomonadales bacterium]
MLRHLAIQNYATVDTLEIEFSGGMTAITGETGAGKSIILGALGFTLGDRADKTIVRTGASKAEISAEFDTSQIDAANQWLAEQELIAEAEPNLCILRRVVNSDGRSRAFINGSSVTLASLKTLGELLLDIHSQHEHQSLLQKATHQRLLDDFGVDKKLRANLTSTWKQWQQNHQQLTQLSQSSEENSAQSQLLSYQLTELDELAIGDNEFAQLEAEFKTLSNAEDIVSKSHQALSELSESEEGNLSNQLGIIASTLDELPEKTDSIRSAQGLLENAQIQIEEAVNELRSFCDSFNADPERLEQINRRLGTLHDVARKHKVSPNELVNLVSDLREQLSRFENSDEELAQLQANDEMLREQFTKLAKEQSKQRKAAAKKLGEQINSQLKGLGMPHASLEVSLNPSESDNPQRNGLEAIEFLVVTNPGQPPQSLIKIASGGELSRISLAIQVITAQTSQTPSLVFDEVDVGIGGGVAKTVGELLRALGERTQILCVTHQAQVAGQGHQHFFVAKESASDSALTSIRALQSEERVKELARMLGGEEFSDESLAHAQKLVANLA